MKIVKKYTGEKTYMFPNGTIATKEIVLAKFPAALTFTHIIESDENEEVMFALQNLSAMRNVYNIDSSLTEEEAIAAIQTAVNTPPETAEAANDPTPEERIAAALEYQVMTSLPDETVSE